MKGLREELGQVNETIEFMNNRRENSAERVDSNQEKIRAMNQR